MNTTTLYSQSLPAIAMDADGDYVVTWRSSGQDGSGYGVYAQRYNAAGVEQGEEFRVNTTTAGNQLNPKVAMDDSGDFVITWMSNGQVYAQRYNSAGTAQGGEFRVDTTNGQQNQTVAMDANGDFVIAWMSELENHPFLSVFARRYDAAGVAQGAVFRVPTTTRHQFNPAVAMDAAGDFVVTWESHAQGGGYGVYAQRFNAAGLAQGGEFRVNTYTTSSQRYSTVAMDPDGDFAVTWMSNGQDGSGEGVYAQLYQGENSVRLHGTTMQILGTDLADTITVDNAGPDLQVTLNGVLSSYDSALISNIIVLALNGDDHLSLGSGITQSARLDGGNGNDTLTGGGGNDQLDGGAGNDVYGFNTNTTLGMDSVIDSAGIDRLSFVGSSGSVTVDLSSTASQIVNANLMLTLNSAASIENVYGGSGDDTLTGNTLANELWGGEGNDSLVGGDGVDWLHGQAGDDSLDGGAGNDTYVFNTNTALGADNVTDSGGMDRLYFVGSTDAITVDLGSTASQIVNASLTLMLASAASLENIDGGSGDDTLIGNSLANSLVGGGGNDSLWGGDGADWLDGQGGNDSLDGGTGDDTYPFVTNMLLGSDSITDSSGIDRLTFYGSTANVAVSLASTASQPVNANLTLILASALSVENITGGSGDDTLTGNTLNNTLSGGAGNDSLDGGDGLDWLYGQAGDDSLDGGAGNDTYVFNTNTALGADNGTDSAGIDQLYFVGSSNDLAVNLGSTDAQTVNSNLTLTLNSATSVENIYGGSGNDTLTGNSLNNQLVGGPGNDVLTGGSGNDGYGFDLDSILGSDTIDESAGGTDTIDFRGTTLRGASIDLSNAAAQVVSVGYLTLTLWAGSTLENVFGGEQGDLLIGNALANRLIGGGGDDILKGAAGNDTYVFDTDSVLGSDSIYEAGGGLDTLDFFETTTRSVIVSLSVTSAQSVNSNLTLTISAIDAIEKVVGGALNDILIGNSLANTLIGNGGDDVLSGRAGNDRLAGGDGKNILIGGFGSDQLSGGTSEDLLLGARYLLEDDTVALDSLRNEWISAGSFDERAGHLLGTLNGGANDGFTLTPSTVKEDSSRDTLNGASGRDWYLRNQLGSPAVWREVINEADLDSLFTEIGSWL